MYAPLHLGLRAFYLCSLSCMLLSSGFKSGPAKLGLRSIAIPDRSVKDLTSINLGTTNALGSGTWWAHIQVPDW